MSTSVVKTSVASLGDAKAMTITLSRPKRKNAFNTQMYLEVVAALKQAAENEDVAVVILTGDGGTCVLCSSALRCLVLVWFQKRLRVVRM